MPKKESDFIPDAVKKQGDAADAAQKKAIKGDKPEPAKPAEPAKPTHPEPAKPKPTTKPDQAKPQDENAIEHKYSVLLGKYNREITELNTALRESRTQLANQGKMIDSLNAMIEKLGSAPAAPAQPVEPIVNKIDALSIEDFGGYGDEMIKLVKVVNDLVHTVGVLEKRKPQAPDNTDVNKRIDRLEQTTIVSVKDRFYDALDKWDLTWGVKNKDQGFLNWLEEIDPVSQVQRKALMKYAFQNWNAKQVIALFEAYFGNAAPSAEAGNDYSLQDQVTVDSTGPVDPNTNDSSPKQSFATKEEMLKAQDDFVKGRIPESKFHEVANSFQAGLAAQSGRT